MQKQPEQAPKPTRVLISRSVLFDILSNPLVYGPLALQAATNAIVLLPLWINISLLITQAAGQIWYWKRNWNYLYSKAHLKKESAYRKHKAEEFTRQITYGIRNKAAQHQFRQAFDRIRDIETKIFADESISPKEEEILDIIEDMLTQAITTYKSKEEVTPEIQEALQALETLHTEFHEILNPLKRPEVPQPKPADALSQTTQKLQHRIQESKRVKELIKPQERSQA